MKFWNGLKLVLLMPCQRLLNIKALSLITMVQIQPMSNYGKPRKHFTYKTTRSLEYHKRMFLFCQERISRNMFFNNTDEEINYCNFFGYLCKYYLVFDNSLDWWFKIIIRLFSMAIRMQQTIQVNPSINAWKRMRLLETKISTLFSDQFTTTKWITINE